MAGAVVPTPPIEATGEDTTILARTLYGEARGEELQGQIAVAWVIVNRALRAQAFVAKHHARHPLFGDGTISAACQSEYRGVYQFSCWNPASRTYKSMIRATTSDPEFQSLLHLAAMVLAGRVDNPIRNCDHYFNPHDASPKWAKGKAPFAAIGHHLFFNNVE